MRLLIQEATDDIENISRKIQDVYRHNFNATKGEDKIDWVCANGVLLVGNDATYCTCYSIQSHEFIQNHLLKILKFAQLFVAVPSQEKEVFPYRNSKSVLQKTSARCLRRTFLAANYMFSFTSMCTRIVYRIQLIKKSYFRDDSCCVRAMAEWGSSATTIRAARGVWWLKSSTAEYCRNSWPRWAAGGRRGREGSSVGNLILHPPAMTRIGLSFSSPMIPRAISSAKLGFEQWVKHIFSAAFLSFALFGSVVLSRE